MGQLSNMTGLVASERRLGRKLQDLAHKFWNNPCALKRLQTVLAGEFVRFSRNAASLMLGKLSDEVGRDVHKFAGGLIELGRVLTPLEGDFLVGILEQASLRHDLDTYRHQKGVTRLADFVAGRLGLDKRTRQALLLACRLHDIGKVAVPLEVLQKTDRLVGEECDFKRLHLLIGYYLLEALPHFREAARILRYNHYFDGYPEGLKAEEMRLPEQILSACDYFDALTTRRAYKDREDNREALVILACRPYDVRIVQCLAGSIKTSAEDIGCLVTAGGERLNIRQVVTNWDRTLEFFNPTGERVGYINYRSSSSIIHFVYVEPHFRNRGYSAGFIDALLKGLREGVITGNKVRHFRAYIRNPLLVKSYLKRGFAPILVSNEQNLRAEMMLGREEEGEKVKIHVPDAARRRSIRNYAENPGNPDWHIFEVVDEAIEGEPLTIFSTYAIQDLAKLDQYLAENKARITYY